MPYLGYYINLDRSPERRATMEARLAHLDPPARYRRFPAVDGNPGEIASAKLTDAEVGCISSHYRLLRSHADGADHLHIVEDDAVLAHHIVPIIEQIIETGLLDGHDLLFTSTVLSEKLDHFADFYSQIRSAWKADIRRAEDGTATDVRFGSVPYLAGMESYLVNRRSIRKICDVIEQDLRRGADKPIDLLIRQASERGALRARCLFPFITSVLPGVFASTRGPDDHRRLSVLAMELLRHSFFVECDLKAALELADCLQPGAKADQDDEHERLHALLAAFVRTDAFHTF